MQFISRPAQMQSRRDTARIPPIQAAATATAARPLRWGVLGLTLGMAWACVMPAAAGPMAPQYAANHKPVSPVKPAPTRALENPSAVISAFAEYFNAGQHEALLSLYEPSAVFIPAPGQAVASPEGIRAATAQFLSLRLPIQIQVRHVFEAGDVALVVSDWSLRGEANSGSRVDLSGTATDVMRRSPSGVWRYVIDNPFGGQRPQQP